MMTRTELLKNATLTFEKQKLAAGALAAHYLHCVTCKSKLRNMFHACRAVHELEFDFRIAKLEADSFRDALIVLNLLEPPKPAAVPAPPWEPGTRTPSMDWLNSLYSLEDTRSE